MYGLFTYVWVVKGVKVGNILYTIHWAFGIDVWKMFMGFPFLIHGWRYVSVLLTKASCFPWFISWVNHHNKTLQIACIPELGWPNLQKLPSKLNERMTIAGKWTAIIFMSRCDVFPIEKWWIFPMSFVSFSRESCSTSELYLYTRWFNRHEPSWSPNVGKLVTILSQFLGH